MKVLVIPTTNVAMPEGTPEVDHYKLWVYDSQDVQVHEASASAPQFPWPSLPLGTYNLKVEARDAAQERVGPQVLDSVVWNNTVQRAIPTTGAAIVEM